MTSLELTPLRAVARLFARTPETDSWTWVRDEDESFSDWLARGEAEYAARRPSPRPRRRGRPRPF